MGVLWGNDTKRCPKCNMIIPSGARKCPFCQTEFENNSLLEDLNEFGCLGYPLTIIIIIILLIFICG